ncbi:MAG: hypothetical protein KTR25_08355, partial [Myxococcales bacterium]|nr:hypothetical protein [Myxococcales bacterium]
LPTVSRLGGMWVLLTKCQLKYPKKMVGWLVLNWGGQEPPATIQSAVLACRFTAQHRNLNEVGYTVHCEYK